MRLRQARVFARAIASVVTAAVLSCAGAGAQEWSATNVQLLHGSGYELGPVTLEILTFEHASGWALGSNFFFFDVTGPFDGETSMYGEWYSRFSWSRLGLVHEGKGLFQDVSFSGSINAGSGFRAYLAGVTLHLKVPGFSFLDLDVMAYDDRSDADVTYIVTPAWETPFSVGKTAWRFRGFIDVIGAEGERTSQVLAQPQLLLDLGSLWGRQSRFLFGVEYQYWRHKYGSHGATESVPQIVLAWQL